MAEAYGVVNKTRKVPFRYTIYIGPDSKILYIDKKVSARSHGKDLVKKLEELGVEKKK